MQWYSLLFKKVPSIARELVLTSLISKDNIPLIQIIPNIKILILLHLNHLEEFIYIYIYLKLVLKLPIINYTLSKQKIKNFQHNRISKRFN